MIDRGQVAVVIPTYKMILSEIEQISLSQVFKVLNGYDIYFVAPEGIEAEYLKDAWIERFGTAYFEGIAGYNKLMLSSDFYRRFEEYKYILLYQLDAFVFSDILLDFCNMGYDYIGAPWIPGMKRKIEDEYVYTNVGNGGFSLRNIQSTIRLLDKNREALSKYSDNEDQFFAFCDSNDFNIAPVSIALNFAFERRVEYCFTLNHGKLPFGCHAWERYDTAFWKPYIEEQGYCIPEEIIRHGKEDMINKDSYVVESTIEKFWTYCKKPNIGNGDNRSIAIFGTGMYGKRVLNILEKSEIPVSCFLDNNVEKQNKIIEQHIVQKPQLLENCDNYFTIIAIAGNSMENVRCQLEKLGKIHYIDYITYMDLIS